MRDGKDGMSLSPDPVGMNPGIAGFLFVAGRMPHARTCGMQTILQAVAGVSSPAHVVSPIP
ncbi:hypothetical protein ASZ90_016264 [hydrocarbon metagenome]|uniref:Uncharacterized protein n=1 Tax=hydrocarbon metagenome TaxID=938273 RepID=A0A0W8EZM2_9ZZZZ